MWNPKIAKDLIPILYGKAKRENTTIELVIDKILRKALYSEPGTLFKGKECRVEHTLFEEA